MKHKVAELEGALLDAAVALAEGEQWSPHALDGTLREAIVVGGEPYAPSKDWALGGPIIERERISLAHLVEVDGQGVERPTWCAYEFFPGSSCIDEPERSPSVTGETALVAAMRCYVASKFGEEVELP